MFKQSHWIQIDFDSFDWIGKQLLFYLRQTTATMFPNNFRRVIEIIEYLKWHESNTYRHTYVLMNFTWSIVCMSNVYLVCKTDPDWTNTWTLDTFSILSINTRETDTCPSRADNYFDVVCSLARSFAPSSLRWLCAQVCMCVFLFSFPFISVSVFWTTRMWH